VYVPFLPQALKEYCGAPVPYIMGVTRGTKVDLSHVVVVDIDNGTVDVPDSVVLPSPPAPHTTMLNKELHEIIRLANGNTQKAYLQFKQAFYNYMLQILWETIPSFGPDALQFDYPAFIEAQSMFNQPFWR
jgi:hypothetical protein